MNPSEYLQSLYERLGPPGLSNFAVPELLPDILYKFGGFVLADNQDKVVLIRRTPIKQYPGIENYWWIPGGAQEDRETLDQTAVREFHEETGLTCTIERTLLAQLADEHPFIAVFFRGRVLRGSISPNADPDCITAEAKLFPAATVPFDLLWSDSDKILLTREGFTDGPIDDLVEKNRLRKHNRVAGGFSPPAPTPPSVRVRTRRFTKTTEP